MVKIEKLKSNSRHLYFLPIRFPTCESKFGDFTSPLYFIVLRTSQMSGISAQCDVTMVSDTSGDKILQVFVHPLCPRAMGHTRRTFKAPHTYMRNRYCPQSATISLPELPRFFFSLPKVHHHNPLSLSGLFYTDLLPASVTDNPALIQVHIK